MVQNVLMEKLTTKTTLICMETPSPTKNLCLAKDPGSMEMLLVLVASKQNQRIGLGALPEMLKKTHKLQITFAHQHMEFVFFREILFQFLQQ